jgi:hypothetical protein
VQLSSFITVLIVLGTVTYIAAVGQGIQDLATVSFPIIVIFAGLTLSRRLFGICIGLTLLAASGLVIGEVQGWLITKPLDGTYSNWFYFLGITIILLIAAFAVDILVLNFKNNYDKAKVEIEQRTLAEKEIEKSEKRFRV